MIVFEQRLGQLVELLPKAVGFTVKYVWGTQDELNKYLALPRNESPYPLIWLTIGSDRESLNEPRVTRNAKILIATVSMMQSEMNPFIYATDYESILVPIAENLIKALQQSGSSMITNNEIQREFLPNFSVTENKGQVDIWNVLALDAEITFNNATSCINTINFN
jgi:hypothetical protein